MLSRIDLRGSALPGARELAGLLPRAGTDIDSVLATVRPLCEDVRIRGAQAVREITARLDGVDSAELNVVRGALLSDLGRERYHLGEHPGDGQLTPVAWRARTCPRTASRPNTRAAYRGTVPALRSHRGSTRRRNSPSGRRI